MDSIETAKQDEILAQVRLGCVALDDRKAERIKILKLGARSSIADYFVVASGTSSPHLRALSGTLEKSLKDEGVSVLSSERDVDSGWVVVDACDVIYHLFTDEMREFYQIEKLWKDAESLTFEELTKSE